MKPALKESECQFTIFGSCGHIYCAGCLPVGSANTCKKFCKMCNSMSLDNIENIAGFGDCSVTQEEEASAA